MVTIIQQARLNKPQLVESSIYHHKQSNLYAIATRKVLELSYT